MFSKSSFPYTSSYASEWTSQIHFGLDVVTAAAVQGRFEYPVFHLR